MEELLFFVAAIAALAGAMAVVVVRNPFYSVLALVAHLFALAILFLLLRAEFLAAAQIVVYAGAVMVLYVFVVAYIGGLDEPLGPHAGNGLRLVAGLAGAALFVALSIAILGTGLQALDTEGPAVGVGFGGPAQLGELLLTRFLLPFEIASYLLLLAAVGAVLLARRRGGLGHDEGRALSVTDVLRPAGTGTMREAVRGDVGQVRRGLGPVQDPADPGPGGGPTGSKAKT